MTRMRTPRPRLAAVLHRSRPPAPLNLPEGSQSSSWSNAADSTAAYLADLLEDTREELTRADSKAALLLAATGVAIGALLAGLLDGKWAPLDLNISIQWIWWLGVAFAAAGVLSIAGAVYPRIHRRGAPHPGAPAYYGDVAAYEDIDRFKQAIGQLPSVQARLVDQTFLISRIVQHKYVLLRRGLRFLLLASLACTGAVLLNIPLRH